MKHPLNKLLAAADASSGGPPTMPTDLADRVMQLARRRGRRRAAASSALALAATIAIGLIAKELLGPRGSQIETPPAVIRADNDGDRAKLARLTHEADSAAAVAGRTLELLQHTQRLSKLQAVLAQPGVMTEVDSRFEQAALAAAQGAEQELRIMNRTDEAERKYEQLIEMYPQTAPAEIARRRLAEMRRESRTLQHLKKEYRYEEASLDDGCIRCDLGLDKYLQRPA